MKILIDKELIEEIFEIHNSECRYDHHGYCQEHNLQPKGECWVERLKDALNPRPKYDRKIPSYSDTFEVAGFKEIYECCLRGDGDAYAAKDGMMAQNWPIFDLSDIPEDATHVVWFNK